MFPSLFPLSDAEDKYQALHEESRLRMADQEVMYIYVCVW
jgi:hypothetical protein